MYELNEWRWITSCVSRIALCDLANSKTNSVSFSAENMDDSEVPQAEPTAAAGRSMPLLDEDEPSDAAVAGPSGVSHEARAEDDTSSGEAV